MTKKPMEFSKKYNYLIKKEYFTEDELLLCSCVYSLATGLLSTTDEFLNKVIFSRYGCRDFENLIERHEK